MAEIKFGEGGFFVQEDEDELFYLLTCTGVGDAELPEGDETPVYCPSPSEVGKFVITDSITAEPGLITYSLTRPLRSTLNYLLTELTDCRFHGRVNWRLKGSTPDEPENFIVALHLHYSKISSRTVPTPAVIQPDEDGRVETNADVSAFDWALEYPITAARIAVTETEAINDMAFDLSSVCYEEEAGGDSPGMLGYATTDALAASPGATADVLFSEDYGESWAATAADPFGGAENAGAVQTRGGRVVVARATADALNPAEIAYSDDEGASWTLVDVGVVDNQVINDLYWLDATHLWASATGGYVYFSGDRGASWTAQTSGGLTTNSLLAIHAIDQTHAFTAGAGGIILKTTDGSTWAVATEPTGLTDDILDIEMRNKTRVFIVTDAAEMWVTVDAAVDADNWAERTVPGQGDLAEMRRIEFDPLWHYYGYMVGNTGGPVGEVYRSRDGGASWTLEEEPPNNAGINAMRVIDVNHAWVGGEPVTTAYIAKIIPVS